MFLQLSYMVLPFQRWDWARYLGSAAIPLIVLVQTDTDNKVVSGEDGLLLCGLFTFMFAMLFQERLLPRLGEGAILMWSAILLWVTVEVGAWESSATYVCLGIGAIVLLLLMAPRALPYLLKLGIYAWFLLAVVAIGVLQFAGSDLSLISAGKANALDYRFALIDGMAGAYIGVHAVYLYELLPIPRKGEQWGGFKKRWTGYLNLVVSRFDDQQLEPRAATGIVIGIALLAYGNHAVGLMPARTLCNLILFGLPLAWGVAAARWSHRLMIPPSVVSPSPTSAKGQSQSRKKIGRARHSRKHRQ